MRLLLLLCILLLTTSRPLQSGTHHGVKSYLAESKLDIRDPVYLAERKGRSSYIKRGTLAGRRTAEVFHIVRRKKRGLFTVAKAILEGSKATNSLLEGASKLVSTTFVKRYQKPGSYMQAMEDFDSVKPTHVRTFILGDADGKIGIIGDRAIVIKSISETGHPTLKIFKPKRIPNKAGDTVIYEIFYM